MPITNHIRDNWCRFQGELFPEFQDAVGPLLKKYRNYSGAPYTPVYPRRHEGCDKLS